MFSCKVIGDKTLVSHLFPCGMVSPLPSRQRSSALVLEDSTLHAFLVFDKVKMKTNGVKEFRWKTLGTDAVNYLVRDASVSTTVVQLRRKVVLVMCDEVTGIDDDTVRRDSTVQRSVLRPLRVQRQVITVLLTSCQATAGEFRVIMEVISKGRGGARFESVDKRSETFRGE